MSLRGACLVVVLSLSCGDDSRLPHEVEPSPLDSLLAKLDSLDWVAYAPTNFNPLLQQFPPEESIRADLEALHDLGFEGVITFGADGTLGAVPRIAKEVGFEGVIMGLFMSNDDVRLEEIDNALAADEFADGYGIGNEGLDGCGGSLYTRDTLVATMDQLRAATGKPVTTSEQIEDYLDGCADFLLANGDWLFPIIHPFNNGVRDPQEGAEWTEKEYRSLVELTDKFVFAKESGWPTDGDQAATEENQEAYFNALKGRSAKYGYFEAFDQPWKPTQVFAWEPRWGLFRDDRSPKLFISRNQP